MRLPYAIRGMRSIFAAMPIAVLSTSAFAAPGWWSERGLIRNDVQPDDYQAVNAGQLKNFTAKAVEELQEKLWSGGAGQDLLDLVASWQQSNAQRDDYQAINAGQLKNVVSKIYARLAAANVPAVAFPSAPPGTPAAAFPWTGTNVDDYQLVNVGQLKRVFDFDITLVDTDTDTLPDWWERKYFQDTLSPLPNEDPDNDKISNADEHDEKTDPHVPDEDRDLVDDRWERQYFNNLAQAATADPDVDGITNLVESQHLLNPTVDDRMGDADGDGIPNIYELNRLTSPSDAGSRPSPDFVVAQDPSGTHASIADAVYDVAIDYCIIKVKAGTYREHLNMGSRPVFIYSEDGPERTVLAGEYSDSVCSISGKEVGIHGFTLTHSPAVTGAGVLISYTGDRKSRVSNCIIRDNSFGDGAGAVTIQAPTILVNTILQNNTGYVTGGLFIDSAAEIIHCTLVGNKANDYAGWGVFRGSTSRTVRIVNCVFWNASIPESQEIFALSPTNMSVSNSVVRGASPYPGVDNTTGNPLLQPQGYLTYQSAQCINTGGTSVIKEPRDIHGEARPDGGSSDRGADEFIDTDADYLPDFVEAAGATNPNVDSDSDGLSNLVEYGTYGTNPMIKDQDGDGLDEDDEVIAGTGLLNPDSDNDGMKDGFEISNLLNPLADDAWQDKDNDRWPNIVEYKHRVQIGTAGQAADVANNDVPAIVPSIRNVGPSETYLTISQALSAAQPYDVVRVKAGTYDEYVNISKPVLLLGAMGPSFGSPARVTVRRKTSIGSDCAIDGIQFRMRPDDFGAQIAAGGGRVKLRNCGVIGSGAGSYSTGISSNGPLEVSYCTIAHHSANSVQCWSGSSSISSSILWSANPLSEDIDGSVEDVTVTGCLIRNAGPFGSSGANPLLTSEGRLRSGSPASNVGGVSPVPPVDLDGESRQAGAMADIGADEFVDTDDLIPDAWETLYFGDTTSEGANGNPDTDGLTNLQEFELGLTPNDADSDDDLSNDGIEVGLGTNPLNSDTDLDQMPDGYEITNQLDPLLVDAMEDKDCDRWPNIFEFKHRTLVNTSGQASDPNSPIPNPYTPPGVHTVSASQSITYFAESIEPYAVINVDPYVSTSAGTYNESVTFYYPVLILGKQLASNEGPEAPEVRCSDDKAVFTFKADAAIDGLRITHLLGARGPGIRTEGNGRVRVSNCIFKDNTARLGAALDLNNPDTKVVHCTFLQNSADEDGNSIKASGNVWIKNSILWNPTGVGGAEIAADGATVTVAHSIIHDGQFGASSVDPQMTPVGRLKSASTAALGNAQSGFVRWDIRGESRPFSTSGADIGADEFIDVAPAPDGLADDWQTFYNVPNPSGPQDSDSLNDLQEYEQGLAPNASDSDGDHLDDGVEASYGLDPRNPDSDRDGLEDGFEVQYGLSPLTDDAWDDLDKDRWPNIIEAAYHFRIDQAGQSTDPYWPSVVRPIFLVDPAQGGVSYSDHIYSTISEALLVVKSTDQVNGVTHYPNRLMVVKVKPGTYYEALKMEDPKADILLISDSTDSTGYAKIATRTGGSYSNATLSVKNRSAIVGFTITHDRKYTGRGIYVRNDGVGGPTFSNCIIAGNKGTTGGGAYVLGRADFKHCTFHNNIATESASGIFPNGNVRLENTIVWNPGAMPEFTGNGNLTHFNCLIREGVTGALTADPLLTVSGLLTATSPARAAGSNLGPLHDINGEARPTGSATDIGADQFVDSDTDQLADAWEKFYFANLTRNASGHNDAPSSDTLDNLTEYQNALNPATADGDADGLNDALELAAGTDSFVADSDSDLIPDGYEVTNGMLPLVDDAFEDTDKDRWPNIFEYKDSTLPPAHPRGLRVQENSNAPGHHPTFEDAIEAAADYSVITVAPGTYEGTVLVNKKVLLLADLTPSDRVVLSGAELSFSQPTVSVTNSAVLDGFVITHEAQAYGPGVQTLLDESEKLRLVNTLIHYNEDETAAGILSEWSGTVELMHSAVIENSGGAVGAFSAFNGGRLVVKNSVLWNQYSPAELVGDEGDIEVSNSIVRGGEYGGINSAPIIDTDGNIVSSSSPAINAGVPILVSANDLSGAPRTADGLPDLGVREYKDSSIDSDNDGLSDEEELLIYDTDPDDNDSDNDGILDGAEVANGLDPKTDDDSLNPDNDGLTNAQEIAQGTSPFNPDSDYDGLTDGAEVLTHLTNPLRVDTDSDGMPDEWELRYGLNPLSSADGGIHSDGDAFTNLQEHLRGTNPIVTDPVPPYDPSVDLKVFTILK